MKIQHDIPALTQSSSSNCVQTATSQFLSFYDINEDPDRIEAVVPVRKNAKGRPMGTLLADIGTWIMQAHKRDVTMHVFDAQIIDRSWTSHTQEELLHEMRTLQEKGVSTARTPYAPLLIDAYVSFLEAGGTLRVVWCTEELLQTCLANGPIVAIINFNYMYGTPRMSYSPEINDYERDTVDGKVLEHAIVITGYADGQYTYNDPDPSTAGQHTVSGDILIGAICAAQLNSDNYMLTIDA